eukprot:gnl/MRDRNA2_/MRDRNA2_81459_c0_seq2.p1 gnl/MRDRNA2_/MRDRNA2_81459_c0~~gnl/MRDRNA2_/MRDRNA2_81459_c0_seq2.p1  ORF type:complete len:109 (-),score=25.77 gnl/MRDRNA2_/MRDRNA2_81459_c0_seq2:2-328(-)
MLPSFFLLLAVVNALVSKNFMPDGPAEAKSTTSLDADMRFGLQKEVQFLLHHQEPVPSAVENPLFQYHPDEWQKYTKDAPELYSNINNRSFKTRLPTTGMHPMCPKKM